MAFIRSNTDPRGWPRIIEEFGVFYVGGAAFPDLGLKEKAESICKALNRSRSGSSCARPTIYVLSPDGLHLAQRDADDNTRDQMGMVCDGDMKSAKDRAAALASILSGGVA